MITNHRGRGRDGGLENYNLVVVAVVVVMVNVAISVAVEVAVSAVEMVCDIDCGVNLGGTLSRSTLLTCDTRMMSIRHKDNII